MDSELVQKEWDFIVVGTGMGGGIIGRRLAENGFSVLFLERGPRGRRSERHGINHDVRDPAARHIRGFWPNVIPVSVDGRSVEILGTVGAGVGGTSVFYAAGLERPEPHDLDDIAGRPHPTGGWPVHFSDFEPYLGSAERFLHVCGEADPLKDEQSKPLHPPPPMSPGDAALMDVFRSKGLHPYRMHMGLKYIPGCYECIGRKCPLPCKMDARSAGIEPALATGRAALIDNCEVTALRGTRTRVSYVDTNHHGEAVQFRAKRFIVSAGAIGSPRLLLASANEYWPEGCANESGLVGRNLMFHLSELIAIWPGRNRDFTGFAKTIALRDFYYRDGRRLGMLQSLGLSSSYGNIVQYLNQKFDNSLLRSMRPLREFNRIPALLATRLLGSARIFAGIIEDMPYAHNRVISKASKPDQTRIEYSISAELLERRAAFRTMVKQSLRGHRSYFLNMDPELNFGHPCGTLRFGHDPRTSVLNPSCRAHALDNLYIVDSSFMPTSTGVNPSLTIAANALRVADLLTSQRSFL